MQVGLTWGMNTTSPSLSTAGAMIRDWRTRRRLSQLDLALEAEVSQRHLSFLESGRANPSREMVIRLAERLSVPLRERNRLLLAAGFAPSYGERSLSDPALSAANDAVAQVLKGHEPNPSFVVDRHWNMVAANGALAPFLAGVDPSLLEPPVNVLRIALHPKGMPPRIANFGEWRAHLLERLHRQNGGVADPVLASLEEELTAYPGQPGYHRKNGEAPAIAVPLQLRHDDRILSFISTITVFGTPLEVELSELAIESFFPSDPETAAFLRALAMG